MKNLIKQFSDLFAENEEFQRRLGNYTRALKTEEWKFLRDALFMIRSEMAIHMFSKSYTQLDKVEKDIVQRTYYNINQMVDFLQDPKRWVSKTTKWKQNFTQFKGKVTPNQKKGE